MKLPTLKTNRPRHNPAERKILLSTHALAKLVGSHRATVLRQLAHGTIKAEAWIDTGAGLQPLFEPTVAITLGRLVPHNPTPPIIS